jgi:hypothetical protein
MSFVAGGGAPDRIHYTGQLSYFVFICWRF